MPQITKSPSVQYNSRTPTTIYTVPAATTAVVKTLIATSQIQSYDTVTINKVSGGVTYPLIYNAQTSYDAETATNYKLQMVKSPNLLSGPISLDAGDVLSISTTTTPGYKFAQATLPTSTGWRIANLHYLNGNYIAVGRDVSLGVGLILTSANGTTWTRRTFNFAIAITDIGFDGTNYVVVGTSNAGFCYRSTDLATWTQQAAPNTTDMYCITYGNSRWVAGGLGGAVWYATTPTAWTAAAIPSGQNVNTILTVGTNWTFGTSGPYTYTADFTTWITPNYLANINRLTIAGDTAGKIYVCSSSSANTSPTTALYTSTNQARTLTAVNLTSVATRPNTALSPFSFNNGARILAPNDMGNVNGTYSLISTDGITWTPQTVPYSVATATYYTNMYPVTGTYYALGYMQQNNNFMINTVAATGVLTNVRNAGFSNTYVAPWTYGVWVPAGNPTSGAWIGAGYDGQDTTYCSYNWGTAPNSGGDGTYFQNAYNVSTYGHPQSALGVPGTNGFLIGTQQGYIMISTGVNAGFTPTATRPFTGVGGVVALAAAGNTATSKIVALSGSGWASFSVDGGVSWITAVKVASNFTNSSYANNSCLTYSNGYWYAVSNTGIIYYTTDGITWNSPPFSINYAATLNSLNIYLNASGGIFYSTGTSADTFTTASSSVDFNNTYPSIRRMTYVSGTYYIGSGNTIYASTDLTTWLSNTTNATQINATTFVYPAVSNSTAAFAYSGSGTSLIMGGAFRNCTSDNTSISVPTVSSLSLVAGSVTASIVEIT